MAAPQELTEIFTLRMVLMQTPVLEKGQEFDSGIYKPGMGPPVRYTVRNQYGPAPQSVVNDAMRNSLIGSLLSEHPAGHYRHVKLDLDPRPAGRWTSFTQSVKLPKSFRA